MTRTHLGGRGLLDGGEDAEGRAELLRDAVVEQGKLPVGRQEAQRARGLELVQPHAVVEVAVVQHHRPVVAATCGDVGEREQVGEGRKADEKGR